VTPSLAQRCVAECLGAAFLLAAVVGSGIMAAKLAGGNGALALLCNTLATGAVLTVLILMLGPVSGAHFNPAVSVAFALRRELSGIEAAGYVGVQLIGALLGVWVAHLMFELPVLQVSGTVRTGSGQWLAEAVATFGLLLTILGCSTYPAGCTLCSGTLHHIGLLVHGGDIVCESGSDTCAGAVRYFRRHRTWRHCCIHRGPARWHAGGGRARPLVMALMRDVRFGSKAEELRLSKWSPLYPR
jgi:glycerol uptake facilitator-like aquaporin